MEGKANVFKEGGMGRSWAHTRNTCPIHVASFIGDLPAHF